MFKFQAAVKVDADVDLSEFVRMKNDSIHQIPLRTITGETTNLGAFQGKVLLIVNVASECGYTPQYADMEKLYQKYKSQGLVVLGFPSNDFGAQEPGSDQQIQQFCNLKYKTTFPMFSKAPVLGAAKHPLYAHLTQAAPKKGEVEWNFEKFLVSRDGKVAHRFVSDVEPMSVELMSAIESLL